MDLGETVTSSYVGASLYRLHVSDAFSGRVGFDMDRGSSFLGVCCVALTLVEVRLEMEEL